MVWTRQPQIITRLDPERAKTIAFVSVSGQNWRQDLKSGKFPTTVGAAIGTSATRFGLASAPPASASGYKWAGLKPIANMGDGYAILHIAAPIAESQISRAVTIGDEAASSYTSSQLMFNVDGGGNPTSGVFCLYEYSGGNQSVRQSDTSAIDGNWHVFLGNRLAGNSFPDLYVDGVLRNVTSNRNQASGVAFTTGVEVHGAPVSNTTGSRFPSTITIIFNRTLVAAEIAQFNNPDDAWKIFQPQVTRIYSFSTGGAVADNLAGAASSVSGATGDLPLGISVAGTSASVASSSGTLALSELLSGAAFSEVTAAGPLLYMLFGDARAKADAAAAIALSEYLAGAGTNISSANANLPLGITISGNAVDQNGVASGTLTLLELLVGAGIAESIVAGSASVVVPLNGVGLSIATAIGDLGFNIFGDASAQGGAAGDLSLSDLLSGTALGFATAGGNATVFGVSSLIGNAVATADANGTISLSVPISGTALAEAISQAQLSLSKPVYGDAVGTAIATGQMALGAVLSGDALVNALASALLGVIVPSFAGSAHANSSALGDTSLGMPLLGAALSIGNANGGLGAQLIQLTGASAAISTTQSLLTLIANLDGTALAEALAAGDTYITATDLLEGDALAEALAAADLSLILNFDANAFAVAGTGGQLSVATPVSSLVPIYIARIKERSYQMQVPFRDYTAQIFQ